MDVGGARAGPRGARHNDGVTTNGASPPEVVPRALVVDWGGVLTVALPAAIRSWAEAEGVDLETYRTVLVDWGFGPDHTGPAAALERGELTAAAFETLLAEEFGRRGTSVVGDGLLRRMLAGLDEPEPRMFEVVRRARAAGLATGLLSNSWGNGYDRRGWDELFDAVVISGEVGMRKPEPRIFEHAASLLGLPLHACLLVDDLERNVDGARSTGMSAVLHRDVDATVVELSRMLGIDLSGV